MLFGACGKLVVIVFTYLRVASDAFQLGTAVAESISPSEADSFSSAVAETLLPGEIASTGLTKARPLAWFHIPKAGSSVINMIVDLPGMCPLIPKDIVVENATFGPAFLGTFKEIFDPLGEGCPGGFAKWGQHWGIQSEEVWQSYWNGHAFGMFRPPEDRLISMWLWESASHVYYSLPAKSAREYAEMQQGTVVKMLNRPNMYPGNASWYFNPGPPTQQELEVAKARLQGFAFIGLTNKWELSMCLAHSMLGGSCRNSDFINSRKSHGMEFNDSYIPYDHSILEGFQDKFDGELQREAERLFDEKLRLYNISIDSCQSCFCQANIAQCRVAQQ